MQVPDPRTTGPDDAAALAEVLHADLQRLAHNLRTRSGAASETMRTTALVNEAYLRLARQGRFREREHFLATAALAMRQVLVGHARQRLVISNCIPSCLSGIQLLQRRTERCGAMAKRRRALAVI